MKIKTNQQEARISIRMLRELRLTLEALNRNRAMDESRIVANPSVPGRATPSDARDHATASVMRGISQLLNPVVVLVKK